MIQGFQKQTKPLSEYERNTLLPAICRGLSTKIGIGNIITSTKIIQGMKSHGYKLDGPRLRKIINYIRNHNLVPCLASNGNGYFVATNAQEIDDCIASIQGRIDSHQALIESLKEQQQKYFQ